MSNMSNILLRRVYLCSRVSGLRLSTASATTAQSEDFFAKNKRLNRPMSPYMLGTAYNIQLTSGLSLTHRVTGLGLGLLLYGGGVAALASQQTNFAQIVQSIQGSVSPSILLAFKVLAGTSMAYHTFNGLRHLFWDFGFGFKLKELYNSGYAVIALTLLSAIAIVLANN